MIEARKVARVMGGRRVLGREIRSAIDLDRLMREGLPKIALLHVARQAAATPGAASRLAYAVASRATIERKTTKLGPLHSERTEHLARLVALAEEVWGDAGEARAWLNAPHPELDGRTPVAAAMTGVGARAAEEALMRGAHGLPL